MESQCWWRGFVVDEELLLMTRCRCKEEVWGRRKTGAEGFLRLLLALVRLQGLDPRGRPSQKQPLHTWSTINCLRKKQQIRFQPPFWTHFEAWTELYRSSTHLLVFYQNYFIGCPKTISRNKCDFDSRISEKHASKSSSGAHISRDDIMSFRACINAID